MVNQLYKTKVDNGMMYDAASYPVTIGNIITLMHALVTAYAYS